jgi:SIR2-like protein
MRISRLGFDRKKAVVILGAGSSRGASCFQKTLLPPPLDADFFSLLEHIKHRNKYLKLLLEFVKDEFGTSHFPKMEEVFTQLEVLSNFHTNLAIHRGARITKYETQLNNFSKTIAIFFNYIFNMSTNKRDSEPIHQRCDHHNLLASNLHTNDTIIPFNYDCLIDQALKQHAGKSWNPKRSYGISLDHESSHIWNPVSKKGPDAKTPIKLLKLHGSLNWNRSKGQEEKFLTLRKNPYDHNDRAPHEIVPPVWNKTISDDPVLQKLWTEARRALTTGPVLIAIGYSVPTTDLLSQALIRVAVAERSTNQKLTHLIVVNPDIHARRRFISLARGGMDSKTSVVELNTISDLAQLLGPDNS